MLQAVEHVPGCIAYGEVDFLDVNRPGKRSGNCCGPVAEFIVGIVGERGYRAGSCVRTGVGYLARNFVADRVESLVRNVVEQVIFNVCVRNVGVDFYGILRSLARNYFIDEVARVIPVEQSEVYNRLFDRPIHFACDVGVVPLVGIVGERSPRSVIARVNVGFIFGVYYEVGVVAYKLDRVSVSVEYEGYG